MAQRTSFLDGAGRRVIVALEIVSEQTGLG